MRRGAGRFITRPAPLSVRGVCGELRAPVGVVVVPRLALAAMLRGGILAPGPLVDFLPTAGFLLPRVVGGAAALVLLGVLRLDADAVLRPAIGQVVVTRTGLGGRLRGLLDLGLPQLALGLACVHPVRVGP